jgi:peroxiredoxin
VFKLNEKFQFPLWSDNDRELALFYGAAKTKTAFAAKRITVVLDDTGRWILNYPSVNPFTHPQAVLDDLKKILE